MLRYQWLLSEFQKRNQRGKPRNQGQADTATVIYGQGRMGVGIGVRPGPRCSLVLKQGFGTLITVRSVKALPGWLFGREV